MKLFLLLTFFPLLVTAAEIKSDSFYNIDTEWTDQDGKIIRLKDYQDHPVVLAMVYFSCPFLCPTITSDIQRIENQLSEQKKSEVRFVLVSFDPVRDTAEKMQAFMKKRKLDPKRWVLLTTKKESKLRELAGIMNFKYQRQDDGEFSHSYVILALDRGGSPAVRIEGPNQDSKAMVEFLKKP